MREISGFIPRSFSDLPEAEDSFQGQGRALKVEPSRAPGVPGSLLELPTGR